MSIKHWIVGTVSILISAYVVPGVYITVPSAVVLAVVLGLINIFIKPLVFLLTLPINVLTLGFFSFVINAWLTMFAAKIVPDFSVASFWSALGFSILLSIVTMLFGLGMKKSEHEKII